MLKHITLEHIINTLKTLNPEAVIKYGFGEPDSYKGTYSELAFEPVSDAKVGDMLAHAESALGKEFTGYKGGEYTMGEQTECYIDSYGEYSENRINGIVLGYWIGEAQ